MLLEVRISVLGKEIGFGRGFCDLEGKMASDRVVGVWERTERVYVPNRAEVRHMYKRYLEGLEKRRNWGDIDREVVLNRCLRLIHDPPEVEVRPPSKLGGVPLVEVHHG